MSFKNSRRQDLKQFFVSLITAFTKTDIKLHLIYCWKKASMNMKVFCLYGAAVIPRVGMLRMVTRINRDKNEIILFWGCKPTKIKIKIYHKAWPIILVILTIIFILLVKKVVKQLPGGILEKGVLTLNRTAKHLCRSLLFYMSFRLEACNFIKKTFQQKCFLWILRTPILWMTWQHAKMCQCLWFL